MAFTKFTKNVLNVSALPDRVQNQAQTLKATFDQAGVDIKAALNALITELEASTSASNLGADVSSVTTKTVQAILTAFEEEIANRYTKNEIDTLVSGNTNDLVADVDVNLTTGVITVTKKDGAVEKFDTAIEKVPAKFEIVESGTSLFLKITNVDGTSTQTDITELMNVYDFSNTNDIAFNVSGAGNEKVVTASIRPNSIGLDKLSLSVMTTLEGYMTSARDSANAAKISEANARSSANTATRAAEKASIAEGLANTAIKKATEAESYAHGGTGTREGEDTDNAKYYSQVAKEVAGGDFVTPTEMEAYAQKKGTAPSFEGTELSGEIIETDVPLEMESTLHISGNSEQDSRSGKNLLKKGSNYVSKTSAGITFTVNEDQSVIISGTNNNTDHSMLFMWNDNDNPLSIPAGTYNVSKTGNDGIIVMAYDGANYTTIMNNTKDTITFTGDKQFRRVYIQISKGTTETFDNFTIYPIMTKSADSIEPYEPYGVQPSPDYPSEIRSVKSKSDNLFDKSKRPTAESGATFTSELDAGVRVTATSETGSACWIRYVLGDISQYIGKTVRFKTNFSASGANTPAFMAGICNSDGTNVKQLSATAKTSGEEISFVIPELTSPRTYLQVGLYATLDVGNVKNQYADFTNIMVTLDSEIKNYQPYGYVPVEAKVEGKNLVSSTSKGYVNSTGEFVSATNNLATDFIEVENGETYSFSAYYPSGNRISRAYQIALYDENFEFISRTINIAYNTPFIISDNRTKYVRAWQAVEQGDAQPYYLQFEKGSTVTPYTPHVSPKTISLPLGDIELRSTPDGTRDTFERVDGVWNKVSNIGNIVLDGVNNAFESKSSTQRNTIWMSTATYESNKDASVMSNRFKGANSLLYENDGKGIYTENNRIKCAFGKNSELTTLELANAWLSSNPTQVDYVLATPTYTPITDTALIQALDELEQLILHKGYNRITVTGVNGVKAYLDLSIPSTASVTNVETTESSAEMIVPVVVGEGDVIPKIPKEENQIKLDLSTGLVKVKRLEVGTGDLSIAQARNIYAGTEELTPGVSPLPTGTIYIQYE